MLMENEATVFEKTIDSDDVFDTAGYGAGYEKETIINFNNAESVASYYTLNHNKRQMLIKLAKEYPDEVKIISQTEDSIEASFPKSWIKIRPPRKMTEEERERMVERGKALAARMYGAKKET